MRYRLKYLVENNIMKHIKTTNYARILALKTKWSWPRSDISKLNKKAKSKSTYNSKLISIYIHVNYIYTGLTREEELVGRIKTEPPSSWKNRFRHGWHCNRRMKIGSFPKSVYVILLMTKTLRKRRSRRRRWRRTTIVRLPKRHSAQTPTLHLRT